MAPSEKLLFTSRSALPFHPRICYGVALSGAAPVTVRARRSFGGIAYQFVPLPDPAALRQPELAAPRRHGGTVAGCLAVQESLTLWLNSPLVSRAKAEKVLPSLLDIQLPFPLEDCIYQFVEFRRTAEGTVSALVCAARREAIQACLERYQAQGADPVLLDHEGLALWTQSLAECPSFAPMTAEGRPAHALPATADPLEGKPAEPLHPQPSYRALICLDPDHTTLVIGCGRRYGSAHSLRMPGPPAADGDLVHRLHLLLHAGLPAGAGVHWLFCGARAEEPAAVEALYRPLASAWPGPLTLLKEPAAFLARALCERALTRGPLRCNLRQQALTHSAVRRVTDRRARAAAGGILAAGLLMAGLSLVSYALGEHRLNRIKAEIAATAGELAPGASIPYGRELQEVQKAWEKQALTTAPFLEAFGPSLAVRLADVITAGHASAVRFETLNLRRNSLTLTGTAEDWDQCGRLEQRLKALGYSVKLERQEAIAETEVRFTIHAEGGGP